MRAKCTKEECIAALQEIYNKKGICREIDLQERKDLPSVTTVIRIFGTWNNAIRAANAMNPKKICAAMYTDDELIEMLKEAYRGKYYTGKEHNEKFPNLPKCTIYMRRFGSWNRTLQLAGIKPKKPTYDDEHILDALRALYKEKGSCRMVDLNKRPDMPSVTTVLYRFGSWRNAVKKAGLTTEHAYKYSDEHILQTLKAAYAARGKYTIKELGSYPGMPSDRTIRRRFGGWRNALKMAGIID